MKIQCGPATVRGICQYFSSQEQTSPKINTTKPTRIGRCCKICREVFMAGYTTHLSSSEEMCFLMDRKEEKNEKMAFKFIDGIIIDRGTCGLCRR